MVNPPESYVDSCLCIELIDLNISSNTPSAQLKAPPGPTTDPAEDNESEVDTDIEDENEKPNLKCVRTKLAQRWMTLIYSLYP